MNNLKVSIIIPVYNAENYLTKCINSVINQSYKELEILLIDDGSRDLSGEILDEYAKNDKRIIVLHKENGGIGSAYNSAFQIMTGDYVCFVDADDYLALDCVEKIVNILLLKNADIVHSGMYYVDINGDIIDSTIDDDLEISGGEKILENHFRNNSQPVLASAIFKKELFDKIVLLEQNLAIDEILTPQLLFNSKKTVYIKEKYYFCYQNPKSVSRQNKTIEKFMQIVNAFEMLNHFITVNSSITAPYVSLKYINFLISYDFFEIIGSRKEKRKCITQQKQKFNIHYKIYKQNKEKSIITRKKKILFALFSLSPRIIHFKNKTLKGLRYFIN